MHQPTRPPVPAAGTTPADTASTPLGNDCRIEGAITRGAAIEVLVDGRPVRAFAGESVAAALLAGGQRALRTTLLLGQPRGLYCAIGICFDCRMTIDGRPNVRACQTPVWPGMRVESQAGEGTWSIEP